MGKKSKPPVLEHIFDLAPHSSFNAESQSFVIDSHTHLVSTFNAYRQKYPDGKYSTVYEFVRAFLGGNRNLQASTETTLTSNTTSQPRHAVRKVVDVWCEAPVLALWKELADTAADPSQRPDWGGLDYFFVMGVHPHEAKSYNDDVEANIISAMSHPRNVGWGEIGLDYHYMNSPADIQQSVFRRQLKHAVRLGKSLTIHTREADEDVERILKEEVPQDHKIHIHCFTDTPALAQRLMEFFPNLYIGITGVVTYKSNENTAEVIRNMIRQTNTLRIVLESDAPYMIPTNIYPSLDLPQNKSPPRLAFSHSGMLPWVAEYVADIANSVLGDDTDPKNIWTTERVLLVCQRNAELLYGI